MKMNPGASSESSQHSEMGVNPSANYSHTQQPRIGVNPSASYPNSEHPQMEVNARASYPNSQQLGMDVNHTDSSQHIQQLGVNQGASYPYPQQAGMAVGAGQNNYAYYHQPDNVTNTRETYPYAPTHPGIQIQHMGGQAAVAYNLAPQPVMNQPIVTTGQMTGPNMLYMNPPDDHMGLSYFSCLCCCWIVGGLALAASGEFQKNCHDYI